MSGTQKRGFRLPWAAEPGPDEGSVDGSIDPPVFGLLQGGNRGDRPGARDRSAASPTADESMDAAPAASDVPETTAEAEMFDTESAPAPSANGARPEDATWGATWPTSDRSASRDRGEPAPSDGDAAAPADGGTPAARPAIRVEADARAPRRENPLVAGLVKAMREAAIASRDESTARLDSEASARTEQLRTEATDEAAALRKQVDDDITGIRDWSKAEMARIRQETEERIEARRAQAIEENKRHSEEVERRVEAVQGIVAAFGAEMASFYEQLLAESDPARLASLAERAPEPPDLSSEALAASAAHGFEVEAALEPHAAAEAEAEATEGLDMMESPEWPAAALAARLGVVPGEAEPGDGAAASQTELLVSGLSSVAAISAFKGAIGQLPDVSSVSVTTGEQGVLIFNVGHEPEADLAAALVELGGFTVVLTDASDGSFTVTAHEAAA
jgi:hypothetical protein